MIPRASTVRDTRNTVLDSVSAHIAVLDRDGVIIDANAPWQSFAVANGTEPGRPARHTGIGANYLHVCKAAVGPESAEAMAACEGIQSVLRGQSDRYSLEYPCHSPNVQRWFILTVTPMRDDSHGAVVMHSDITARHLAEDALRESERRSRDFAQASADLAARRVPFRDRVSVYCTRTAPKRRGRAWN